MPNVKEPTPYDIAHVLMVCMLRRLGGKVVLPLSEIAQSDGIGFYCKPTPSEDATTVFLNLPEFTAGENLRPDITALDGEITKDNRKEPGNGSPRSF